MDALSATHRSVLSSIPCVSHEECERMTKHGHFCASGAFGTIYRTYWNGRDVALKIFDERVVGLLSAREVAMNAHCDHTNIVHVLAAGPDLPGMCAYMLLEYAECFSLNEVLHHFKELNYNMMHVHSWALQVAVGTDYLHHICQPPVIHGDLKPANMLLFNDGLLLKISDFGTASAMITMTSTPALTPAYTAPELFQYGSNDASKHFTEKCDVYSFGISIWEICTRHRPFQSGSQTSHQLSFWDSYKRRPPRPQDCEAVLWELIQNCWHEDPNWRPSMHDVVSSFRDLFHPEINSPKPLRFSKKCNSSIEQWKDEVSVIQSDKSNHGDNPVVVVDDPVELDVLRNSLLSFHTKAIKSETETYGESIRELPAKGTDVAGSEVFILCAEEFT